MANRVLLGQDGSDFVLKVSKAGTNVLTASDQDLLFDSTKPEAALILKTGSVSVTTDSTGVGVSSWVNFSKTYSYEPIVFISRDITSNNELRNAPEVESLITSYNVGTGKNPDPRFRSTTSIRTYVETQVSRFRVHIDDSPGNNLFPRPNGILVNTTYSFRYLVVAIGGASSS
jgi:hypothetical protein